MTPGKENKAEAKHTDSIDPRQSDGSKYQNFDRRVGTERRKIPDRRSGFNRRSGKDRRASGIYENLESDKLVFWRKAVVSQI